MSLPNGMEWREITPNWSYETFWHVTRFHFWRDGWMLPEWRLTVSVPPEEEWGWDGRRYPRKRVVSLPVLDRDVAELFIRWYVAPDTLRVVDECREEQA